MKRKLTNSQAERARELLELGSTVAQISTRYGLSKTAVRYLVMGLTYKDAGGPISTIERNPPSTRTLSRMDVIYMRNAYEARSSVREIAKEVGVSVSVAHNAIAGNTYKEILPHAVLRGHPLGSSHSNSKLDIMAVRLIRLRRESGNTISSLARENNVSDTCIRKILNGETWRHVK